MNGQKSIVAVWLLMAGFGCAQMGLSQSKSCDVVVDFSKATRTIRHLNDVNEGPLCERGWVDLSPSYKELGIKYVRLHDVPWSFDDAANINYLFPRFEADPDKPDSYDFFQTDWYLKSIESLGIGIIYGLGPTAEYPKLPPRHIDPPKDYEKWAKICVNVIKHYNAVGQTATTTTSNTGRSGTNRIFRISGQGRRRNTIDSMRSRLKPSRATIPI